jgi:hypothetical protein
MSSIFSMMVRKTGQQQKSLLKPVKPRKNNNQITAIHVPRMMDMRIKNPEEAVIGWVSPHQILKCAEKS